MKWKIKQWISILMTLAFVFSLADGLMPLQKVEAKKKYIAVLDAGHDEDHPGTRYDGLEEENITYSIVEYCKEYLEDDYGIKVYLARPEEDCPVGGGAEIYCLEYRPKVAKKKKADVFVSFHINSSVNTVPNGIEVWTATMYANTEVGTKSRDLAQKCLSQLLKLGFANRGLKTANHVVTKRANEYGIPACLIEHGFVRNPSDRRWMSSDSKIKKLAKADATAIAQFLKAKNVSDDEDEDDEESYSSSDDEEEEDVEYYDGNAAKKKKKKAKKNKISEDEDSDYIDSDSDEEDADSDGVDDDAKLNKSNGNAVYATMATGESTSTVSLIGVTPGEFNSLAVSWNAFDGAKKYKVFRRTDSGKKKRLNLSV